MMTQINKPEVNPCRIHPKSYSIEAHQKRQIVLRDTHLQRGISGNFKHLMSSPGAPAIHYVIDFQGKIHQLIDDNHWGHHLNIPNNMDNAALNRQSICIGLDAWGALKNIGDKYFAWPKDWTLDVDPSRVIEYETPWNGWNYFERYTDAQCESLTNLLQFLCVKHGIPLKYDAQMFKITSGALNYKPGVFTMSAYRVDRSDLHPQSELITAIQNAETLINETS